MKETRTPEDIRQEYEPPEVLASYSKEELEAALQPEGQFGSTCGCGCGGVIVA